MVKRREELDNLTDSTGKSTSMNVILVGLCLVGLLALTLADSSTGEWEPQWIPDTEGWKTLMNKRAHQAARIVDNQQRWDAYVSLTVAGLLTPNYTKNGYEVVDAPAEIYEELKALLEEGMDHLRKEASVDQISGEKCDFISVPNSRDILRRLQPLHEEWAGVKLRPSNAYGLRLYREGNWLTMHTDNHKSHIISSVLHVARDVDEPYPLVIEGYDGKTVAVDLLPGQMLFYESAKCFHGRPRPMKGNFYTSLFIHYAPVDYNGEKIVERAAAAFGRERYHTVLTQDNKYAEVQLKGTGWYNPACPDNWCDLSQEVITVKTGSHDEL